jgi:hypothetical protein
MGMMRSLVGMTFILCSVPLLVSSWQPIPSYIGLPTKTHDLVAGLVLLVAGVVLGKYWVIRIHKPKSN